MYKDTPPDQCPPRIRDLIVLEPRTWNFVDSLSLPNEDLFDRALSYVSSTNSTVSNTNSTAFSPFPTFSPLLTLSPGVHQSVHLSMHKPPSSLPLPPKSHQSLCQPLGQESDHLSTHLPQSSLSTQLNPDQSPLGRSPAPVKPRPIFNKHLPNFSSDDDIQRTSDTGIKNDNVDDARKGTPLLIESVPVSGQNQTATNGVSIALVLGPMM
jgi:hypothetical protein